MNEAGRPTLPPLTYYAKITVVVLAVLVVAVVLYTIRSVALSIFLGLFLAIGAEPFIAWLQRKGLTRGWAVTVLALGALVVLAGMIALLVYPAIKQIGQLVESLPTLLQMLTDRLDQFGVRLDDPAIRERLEGFAEKLPSVLGSSLGVVYGVLGGILSGVFTTFTVVALALYFMLAMPRLRAFIARWLGRPDRVAVLDASLARVGGYVTGQLAVSLTAGVVSGIVLGIMGVPYAAVLGVAMALFTAIPQVGATIGAVVCTLVALTESPTLAIATFVFLLVYQQFENYVLAPRVFGKAVDLSPVAVFVAVLVGGAALGAIGALTALPVVAALKVVMRHVFRRDLQRIEEAERAEAAAQRADRAAAKTGGGGPATAPTTGSDTGAGNTTVTDADPTTGDRPTDPPTAR